MSTFETILMILLVLDALTLAVLVLIQQGQGANIGAAFGSGSSNTMFGSAGSASFLTKLTVWLAIGFFLISFGLAYTAKERAARLTNIGIPQVTEPAVIEESQGAEQTGDDNAAPQELTPDSDSVDSDIPDV